MSNEEDEYDPREPIDLTGENQISDEVRAALKRLGPALRNPRGHPGWTFDDTSYCDWVTLLRDTQTGDEWGYVSIIPLRNGDYIEFGIKPDPGHAEWALHFVNDDVLFVPYVFIPDIWIKASLPEAKRKLDVLLGVSTPEIPREEEE